MRRHRLIQSGAIALAAGVGFDMRAFAGQFSISKGMDSTIDPAAWVANTSAPYGRAMNGNSFETSTLTTFNGYQYTAYWQNSSGAGHVAVARRALGTSAWQSMTLLNVFRSSANSNDAHDVISLGIDPTDGTIHLAFDMHSQSMRYRGSVTGLATNPGSFTWNTASAGSLFHSEQNNLDGTALSDVTYPTFIRTPDNDLQLAFRRGISGNGSWWIYDYSGATHTWTNGHQIDDGTIDSYNGTSSSNSTNRNNYPNNFSYGPDGKLHSTFTWRESATGAANHDIMYVYSDDGGATWKNNAGTIVGSESDGTKFHLNSPGLVVRPMAESQTLMNQNGQAVDHANHPHAIVWHRDSAKGASTGAVWEPQNSSYFQYWRDDLGNWHQNKINANVGTRPKILFDANDNAIAIWQARAGGVAGSDLYPVNGDLVIAAASKASNWTDWKIVQTETGNFVTEAQADPELFASTGSLSITMQNSPTLSGNQGTALRALDYSLSYTAPAVGTFNTGSGDWDVAGNWIGGVPGTNKIVIINNDRTARVDQVVPTLDNMLVIGSGGSGGTLNVVAGGSLNLLGTGSFSSVYGGSIIVGRDSGSVGAYTQSGGTVNAWRFAVGDYFNETSGGGASSATVSGGTLTTYELDVAFSANGSSSGSSFTVAGGTVNVNGDVIIGEFGNSGSVNVTSGQLNIAGDLREGFNQTNNSTFRMDGGVLDMSANSIAVDKFIYNGGAVNNVSTISTQSLSGITVGTLLIGPNLNAGSTTTLSIPANVRASAANRIELWSGGSLALASGAAVSVGTTPSFTANQVSITSGGILAGDGIIASAVNNIGGTIQPGHSLGTLHLANSFVQGAAGAIEVELGGTGADQLAITGAATLNGTLRVKTIGSFTPLPGQTFDVMSFASRSGDVALDNQLGFAGLLLSKNYSATKLTLLASAKFAGDANLDAVVNTLDFSVLASNFNSPSANWLQGDFNGDGIVNAIDFNTLASNYGSGTPGAALGSVVPEPGVAMFASVAILFVRSCRSGCRSRKRRDR